MPSDRLNPPRLHGDRNTLRSGPIALATMTLGAELEIWARPLVPVLELLTEINADVADQLKRRLAEQYFWEHPDARKGLRRPSVLRHVAIAVLDDVCALG